MPSEAISPHYPAEKQRVTVNGLNMAYVEIGAGDPIVFLHGNPTSSYLWRNVMPHLADRGRCIAPDLIGMGDSDKLPRSGVFSYTLATHRRYVFEFLDKVAPDGPVTLVLHDWGGALGFAWARRHPERVAQIAYMETLVTPFTWADWPDEMTDPFLAIRSPAGEEMIIEQNLFIEQILPSLIQRTLTEEEMNEYRKPYTAGGESRRPTLTWPRQVVFDEREPYDVAETLVENEAFMQTAPFPKLFVNGDPGFALVRSFREACRTWPNQKEIAVPGLHFIQEDSPHEIGRGIREWLDETRPRS